MSTALLNIDGLLPICRAVLRQVTQKRPTKPVLAQSGDQQVDGMREQKLVGHQYGTGDEERPPEAKLIENRRYDPRVGPPSHHQK